MNRGRCIKASAFVRKAVSRSQSELNRDSGNLLGSDDEQDSIRTFMETRQANGFNWMALNVGAATHLIEVKAELTTTATVKASAKAVLGNRTLIVEPTKAANNETVAIN